MKIEARLQNGGGENTISLRTDASEHTITIPPKPSGKGSGANGGELLFLALATCYCNDVYREAAKRSIDITRVDVSVEGDFGAAGEPVRRISYSAKVAGRATESDLRQLMKDVDTLAEIQNTVRTGTPVTLTRLDVGSLSEQS